MRQTPCPYSCQPSCLPSHRTRNRGIAPGRWLLLVLLLAVLNLPPVTYAASIPVTTTDDVVDTATGCADLTWDLLPGNDGLVSLREAICAANNTAGPDTIVIPAGTYTLSIGGPGEEAAETGDLDITDDLTITGAGPGAGGTVINGNGTVTGDRIFDIQASLEVTIQNLTLVGGAIQAGNGDDNGGAIRNLGGNLTLSNVHIGDPDLGANVARLFGGGVYNDYFNGIEGNVTIQNSVVYGNEASERGGGGVASYGFVVVTNSSFIANMAPEGYGGGGIFAFAGAVSISGSTFSGNQGYEGGGAATRQDGSGTELEIRSSTFSGNRATGSFGVGGGISSNGNLLIEDSTFSGNISPNDGGGLYHINENASIINSTFSGNRANGSGGGIYFRDMAMRLDYVTITGNTADADNDGEGDGGGLYFASSPEMSSSIIAENHDLSGGGPDCFFMDLVITVAALTSLDYNLVGDTTGCPITGATANNITGASPNLGPLQNNGGPTETHALLPGSPAINAADPAACPAADQRGVSRPQPAGGRCDIGAYEGQYPEIEVRVGPTDIPVSTGSFDFGATLAGTPVEVTFTVYNTGGSDLILIPPITLPPGFSVASDFATTTVPPGNAATFVIRLDAAAAGTFSGQLSFGNNDSDENPYSFLISGTVNAVPTATPTITPSPTPIATPRDEKGDDKKKDRDEGAPTAPTALPGPQSQRFDCWPWLVIVPPGAAPDVAPGQWCQASAGQPLPAPATLRYLDHSTEVALKDSAGNPITGFALPIKICFRYTQPELEAVGGDPASFLIQVFRNGQWEALPTAPDGSLGEPGVCAPVDHLTLFALFERPHASQTFPKYLPETGARPGGWAPGRWWAGLALLGVMAAVWQVYARLRRRYADPRWPMD